MNLADLGPTFGRGEGEVHISKRCYSKMLKSSVIFNVSNFSEKITISRKIAQNRYIQNPDCTNGVMITDLSRALAETFAKICRCYSLLMRNSQMSIARSVIGQIDESSSWLRCVATQLAVQKWWTPLVNFANANMFQGSSTRDVSLCGES